MIDYWQVGAFLLFGLDVTLAGDALADAAKLSAAKGDARARSLPYAGRVNKNRDFF